MELTNRSLPVSCTLLHDSFHDFCIPLKTPSLLFFNFMSHLVFVSSSAKLALVILLLSDYWLPPLLLLFLHQRKWNDDKSCFCSTSLCDCSLDFVSIIHFLHSYVTVCAAVPQLFFWNDLCTQTICDTPFSFFPTSFCNRNGEKRTQLLQLA